MLVRVSCVHVQRNAPELSELRRDFFLLKGKCTDSQLSVPLLPSGPNSIRMKKTY